MRIDIATLFPEMVDGILSESIVGRARKKGAIEISCHQIIQNASKVLLSRHFGVR